MPNTDAAIIRADALKIPLKDDSVDLIISSPPYWSLREYTDDGAGYKGQIGMEANPSEFLKALLAVTGELARIMKPSGSMWINLGDKRVGSGGHNNSNISRHGENRAPKRYRQTKEYRPKTKMLLPHRYAIACMDDLGLICRQDQIWDKPNCIPGEVLDRTRDTHEYWFHFTKEEKYYSAIDELRVPVLEENALVGNEDLSPEELSLGTLPSSVWTVPSEQLVVPEWMGVQHWAAFPSEWPRKLILGWSPPGYCLACDEPLKTVVRKEFIQTGITNRKGAAKRDLVRAEGDNTGFNKNGYPTGYHRITVLGYDCVCTPAVDGVLPTVRPPTRPAIVFDPFLGTGTTAMAARVLGRYGLGTDLSADYLRLAKWRIWESPAIGKIRSKVNAERQGTLAL